VRGCLIEKMLNQGRLLPPTRARISCAVMKQPATTFRYFAYGSNMLAERMIARCPSARRICVARAPGRSVDFSKHGRDGSGKAALIPDHTSAFGVVFEVDLAERDSLDSCEGKGYRRVDDFQVRPLHERGKLTVSTYLAKWPRAGLRPFEWYLQLILAGCRQSGLPEPYTRRLSQVPFIADPATNRRAALEARMLLSRTWYAHG
jgi:AIG2-like family